MRILHITPHLGGGVGKAHAAIRGALPREVEQTFLLLEEARDRRYVETIESGGARVITTNVLGRAAEMAEAAHIVQFEFWNHPRLFECLARSAFPAMRSVFWSHVSGLNRPVIHPGLIEQAGRFVFTTEASRSSRAVRMLSVAARGKIAVINSGFGFPDASRRALSHDQTPGIAYLGTVDFVKMHPGFFDAVDRLDGDDIRVSVWGEVDRNGAVAARAQAMRHPERIHFGGQAAEPAAALCDAEIFLYPLRPDHYGTSENALIEAMSLGLVPVVMNNPAEMAIVRHGETGFVARSIEECTALLQMLLASPLERQRVAVNAARHVAETRTPARSARKFMELWQGLGAEPKTQHNFRSVVGDCPADWFLATQCLPGEIWQASEQPGRNEPSKGELAHFQSAFPGDASLGRFAGAQSGACV